MWECRTSCKGLAWLQAESQILALLSHSQPTAMRAHYGYLWERGLSRKGGTRQSIFPMWCLHGPLHITATSLSRELCEIHCALFWFLRNIPKRIILLVQQGIFCNSIHTFAVSLEGPFRVNSTTNDEGKKIKRSLPQNLSINECRLSLATATNIDEWWNGN